MKITCARCRTEIENESDLAMVSGCSMVYTPVRWAICRECWKVLRKWILTGVVG